MGLNFSNRQIAAELEMSETQIHEMTTTLRTGIVPQEDSIELSSTVECDEVYVIAGHSRQPGGGIEPKRIQPQRATALQEFIQKFTDNFRLLFAHHTALRFKKKLVKQIVGG